MQESVYAHPFLQRAARGSITILLHLLDYPEDLDGLGHLSAADRKKEKVKIKKRKEKEMKAFEEKEKAQADEAKWNGKENVAEELKDSDPFGEKILLKNFLGECGEWCALIAPFRIENETVCGPDTLALVCDVMIRRGKYATALRALTSGLRIEPDHPALSVMLVKFGSKMGGGLSTVGGTSTPEIKTAMQEAVSEGLAQLLGGTLSAFALKYAERARHSSLAHKLAAARITMLTVKDKAQGKATSQDLLLSDLACLGSGVTAIVLEDILSVSQSVSLMMYKKNYPHLHIPLHRILFMIFLYICVRVCDTEDHTRSSSHFHYRF